MEKTNKISCKQKVMFGNVLKGQKKSFLMKKGQSFFIDIERKIPYTNVTSWMKVVQK